MVISKSVQVAVLSTLLSNTGSTPLDLFKFYVEDLKEQYGQDRRVIKDILNDQKKAVQVSKSIKW